MCKDVETLKGVYYSFELGMQREGAHQEAWTRSFWIFLNSRFFFLICTSFHFLFLSMQHAVEKWLVSPRYLTSRKSGTTTLHHGEGLALLDKPFMCGPQTQGHVRLSSFQRDCKENSQKTRKLDLFASFMILWIYVVYMIIICVHNTIIPIFYIPLPSLDNCLMFQKCLLTSLLRTGLGWMGFSGVCQ